jgi:hypothetical protein
MKPGNQAPNNPRKDLRMSSLLARVAADKPSPERRVPVTERALLRRINRRIAKGDFKVKVCRRGRWEGDLGRYFIVDESNNTIAATHVDLTAYGRELECLGDFETLITDYDAKLQQAAVDANELLRKAWS